MGFQNKEKTWGKLNDINDQLHMNYFLIYQKVKINEPRAHHLNALNKSSATTEKETRKKARKNKTKGNEKINIRVNANLVLIPRLLASLLFVYHFISLSY